MLYSEFVDVLSAFPGVVRFEALSQDIMRRVMDLEYSPRNIGFTPVDPEGVLEISNKNVHMVLFCDGKFPMFTQPFMDILDKNGRLIGFDIMDRDKHIFNSDNFIWLTDNLFVDIAMLDSRGELRTVMHSVSFPMPGLPDDVKPRVYYPSIETARYLNKHFRIKSRVVSTVLLGVDLQTRELPEIQASAMSEINMSG